MHWFTSITSAFVFACAPKHEVRSESSVGHRTGSWLLCIPLLPAFWRYRSQREVGDAQPKAA
jgi:hypothetical protein